MGTPLWESVDDDEDVEYGAEPDDYSNFDPDNEPEDLTEAMSDYSSTGYEPEPPALEEVVEETMTSVQEVDEPAVSSVIAVAKKPQPLWSDDTSASDDETEYVSKEVQITKKTNEVEYPFLYMNLGSQCAVEVNLIKAMLRQGVQDSEDPYYHVYLNIGGQVVRPEGVICCRELKTLLTTSIFKDVEKHIKLDADTTLRDELMFALCMVDTF